MATERLGQTMSDTETAGVVARPPLLLVGSILLGHVCDHFLPRPFVVPGTDHVVRTLGSILILGGFAVGITAIRHFSRAETPVRTIEPTRALVTTGVFRWTRNPIYVGMLLICCGVGIALRSTWTLIFLLPLALVLRYGVIAREEGYLDRRFGEAYRDYKAHVRRWL
jgi:protein-S-isoprenylcysteine O-methyltransferase Ste14